MHQNIHISKKKKNVRFDISIPVPSFKTYLKQFVSDGPNEHFLVYVMFDHVTEVPLSTCSTISYLQCKSVG